MFKDKSATHVRVIKNGEESWIVKSVWESSKDKAGFSEIPSTPLEVKEMNAKVKEKETIEIKKKADVSKATETAKTTETVDEITGTNENKK